MNSLTARFYCLLCFMLIAPLALAGVHKQVHFARGASGTVLEGSVLRGESDTYSLSANSDQSMSVKIHSEEDNAAFAVYGEVDGNWVGLPGANEGDDATSWSGSSPDGGNGHFKIVVGPTRGNASYTLELSIK